MASLIALLTPQPRGVTPDSLRQSSPTRSKNLMLLDLWEEKQKVTHDEATSRLLGLFIGIPVVSTAVCAAFLIPRLTQTHHICARKHNNPHLEVLCSKRTSVDGALEGGVLPGVAFASLYIGCLAGLAARRIEKRWRLADIAKRQLAVENRTPDLVSNDDEDTKLLQQELHKAFVNSESSQPWYDALREREKILFLVECLKVPPPPEDNILARALACEKRRSWPLGLVAALCRGGYHVSDLTFGTLIESHDTARLKEVLDNVSTERRDQLLDAISADVLIDLVKKDTETTRNVLEILTENPTEIAESLPNRQLMGGPSAFFTAAAEGSPEMFNLLLRRGGATMLDVPIQGVTAGQLASQRIMLRELLVAYKQEVHICPQKLLSNTPEIGKQFD